jgi:hypothetical protein
MFSKWNGKIELIFFFALGLCLHPKWYADLKGDEFSLSTFFANEENIHFQKRNEKSFLLKKNSFFFIIDKKT